MPEPSKKRKEDYVWIYGYAKKKRKCYEFHPKLQQHIENNFKEGKRACKVYIFGTVWTLDFTNMTKTKGTESSSKIKRIKRSEIKKFEVVGVNGVPYDPDPTVRPTGGFQQADNVCNICLYDSTIPTRIETCGHVFCFMCLKSNFIMGMECPTCRAEIPAKLFDVPIRNDLEIDIDCPEEYEKDCASMFTIKDTEKKGEPSPKPIKPVARPTKDKYYWIYESHSFGWYRYDPKNEKYLEECYLRKKKICTLFICGSKMTIRLKNFVQEKTVDGEVNRRKIRRILATRLHKYPVKGIAGIRSYVHPID